MERGTVTIALLTMLGGALLFTQRSGRAGGISTAEHQTVELPDPRSSSDLSVEEAIEARRSKRSFRDAPLAMTQVAQILWAAQGLTSNDRYRAAPSAGALYPLEVFVVVGAVRNLAAGVYRYAPRSHGLVSISSGDRRRALAEAALGQDWIDDAPVVLVIGAVYSRTMRRYGERGRRYVHMEVGHAAQNVYLQAEALGLGTTIVGAFRDQEVSDVSGIDPEVEPLAILPVGHPR